MDETLRNAIERRDALKREVAAWDAFIEAYSFRFAEPPSPPETPPQPDLFTVRRKTRAEKAAAIHAQMDKAERLILEAGRPLSRSELLKGLQAGGFAIEGRDQSKVLGTNLWRSRRFHNIVSGGYWPRSVPIPAPFDQLPKRDTMLG